MKKLKFETSKSRFLLIDSKDAPSSFNRYLRDIEKEFGVQLTTGYKLSEITELQASEIVFRIGHHSNNHLIPTAKELLYSLLESKGVHLFKNPYVSKINPLEYKEAKEKTFKNPYIFKI